MRRTTDVLKPLEQQRTIPGAGGAPKDRNSSNATDGASAGVSLLLGRRADCDRDRGRKEESVGEEQVKPNNSYRCDLAEITYQVVHHYLKLTFKAPESISEE